MPRLKYAPCQATAAPKSYRSPWLALSHSQHSCGFPSAGADELRSLAPGLGGAVVLDGRRAVHQQRGHLHLAHIVERRQSAHSPHNRQTPLKSHTHKHQERNTSIAAKHTRVPYVANQEPTAST